MNLYHVYAGVGNIPHAIHATSEEDARNQFKNYFGDYQIRKVKLVLRGVVSHDESSGTCQS